MRSAVLGLVAGATAIISIAAEGLYAGSEKHGIKALSQEQMQGYLDGKGMGYARAAELNRYPGPRHVLDLADELELDDDQIADTRAIHDTMHSRATELGRRIVDRERKLDRKFADQSVDREALRSLVTDIGHLEARLRRVHLMAHLEQRSVLSERQIARYDELRGYATDHADDSGHSH